MKFRITKKPGFVYIFIKTKIKFSHDTNATAGGVNKKKTEILRKVIIKKKEMRNVRSTFI